MLILMCFAKVLHKGLGQFGTCRGLILLLVMIHYLKATGTSGHGGCRRRQLGIFFWMWPATLLSNHLYNSTLEGGALAR